MNKFVLNVQNNPTMGFSIKAFDRDLLLGIVSIPTEWLFDNSQQGNRIIISLKMWHSGLARGEQGVYSPQYWSAICQ